MLADKICLATTNTNYTEMMNRLHLATDEKSVLEIFFHKWKNIKKILTLLSFLSLLFCSCFACKIKQGSEMHKGIRTIQIYAFIAFTSYIYKMYLNTNGCLCLHASVRQKNERSDNFKLECHNTLWLQTELQALHKVFCRMKTSVFSVATERSSVSIKSLGSMNRGRQVNQKVVLLSSGYIPKIVLLLLVVVYYMLRICP